MAPSTKHMLFWLNPNLNMCINCLIYSTTIYTCFSKSLNLKVIIYCADKIPPFKGTP